MFRALSSAGAGMAALYISSGLVLVPFADYYSSVMYEPTEPLTARTEASINALYC